MKNKSIVKAICKELRKAKKHKAIWSGFEDTALTEEQQNTYYHAWKGYRRQERALRNVLRAVLEA